MVKSSSGKNGLGFWGVFAIASGAMISSGLFVLPAVVYDIAGPAIIISYLLAAFLMLPSLASQAELATAMPKSGGSYFFINRSLGALMGTFAGFSNWFSITLKGAFALVGMGAFLRLAAPEIGMTQIKLVAVGLVGIFLVINIFSVKESGKAQVIMVAALISILVYFIGIGIPEINTDSYTPFAPAGIEAIIAVTGMVFISYGGLTKVASVAGEVHQPGKILPKAMFLSFFVVNAIYLLSVAVVVGVLSHDVLASTLTPLSVAADTIGGGIAMGLLTTAALLSFATTANASLMSASRAPLAMAKDHLLPKYFAKTSKTSGTPIVSLLATGLFMAGVIMGFDISNLVKVASTMMIILFLLLNISVILMRESRIITYRPSYRAPFYPVLQIAGIITAVFLITEMGSLPLILSGLFFAASISWYFLYCRKATLKDSALIRVVERVASREIRGKQLHEELLDILSEHKEVEQDRFDQLIKNAAVLDITERISVNSLFNILADVYAERLSIESDEVLKKLHKRENESTTAIYPGLAIPHIILESAQGFEIIVVRAKRGIYFSEENPNVETVFSLAGGKEERPFHLKALMTIAQIYQNENFQKDWKSVRGETELRNLILITKQGH